VATVFLSNDIGATKSLLILAALLLGAGISIPVARRIPMTDMPQLVAILNGVGGFATVIVGMMELAEETGGATFIARAAIAFIILVGSLSLTGSILTYLKLQGIMSARPIVIPAAAVVMVVVMAVSAAVTVTVAVTGSLIWAYLLVGLGLLSGVLMLLPIGGADAPVEADPAVTSPLDLSMVAGLARLVDEATEAFDGYDYARDFGGIRYVFCRGLDASRSDSPGIHAQRFPPELVDALDALFLPVPLAGEGGDEGLLRAEASP